MPNSHSVAQICIARTGASLQLSVHQARPSSSSRRHEVTLVPAPHSPPSGRHTGMASWGPAHCPLRHQCRRPAGGASSPLAVPQVAASTRFRSPPVTKINHTPRHPRQPAFTHPPVPLARPPTKRNAVPPPALHVGPPLVLPLPCHS